MNQILEEKNIKLIVLLALFPLSLKICYVERIQQKSGYC